MMPAPLEPEHLRDLLAAHHAEWPVPLGDHECIVCELASLAHGLSVALEAERREHAAYRARVERPLIPVAGDGAIVHVWPLAAEGEPRCPQTRSHGDYLCRRHAGHSGPCVFYRCTGDER